MFLLNSYCIYYYFGNIYMIKELGYYIVYKFNIFIVKFYLYENYYK